MSDNSLAVVDHTVQQTNIWLKKLVEEHHLQSRHQAYSALRAVLHALRDRLTSEQAVHLGAQLPLLIRGIYYEGWRVNHKPLGIKRVDEFAEHVAKELPPNFPRDPVGVSEAVFDLLAQELDPGEIHKVIGELPVPLRSLWPEQLAH